MSVLHKIEYQKIRQVLQLNEQDDFTFLKQISDTDLKNLRIRISEIIDLEQVDIWPRIGKVASFMPNFLNAKVAETILGPMIAANLANHVPIKDAVAILKNLSTTFLSEVAGYMIPEKSVKLIDNIPIDILKKVTISLVEQKKYFVASNFVNALPIQRIITLSEVIYNELDLILIAEFVENKAHIAKIIEQFNDNRTLEIIKTAYSNDKQEVILSVFVHVSKTELNRILKLLDKLPESVRQQIIEDFKNRIDE